VVQEQVLEKISDESLAVYVVWEPILRTDTERSARKATTLLPDKRVRNYWIGSQSIGEMFQGPLFLEGEPAWDVYLVYGPEVTWDSATPPRPDFYMHQLGGLPEPLRLKGSTLATVIGKMLR
jgi:hypothetical protein